MRLFLGLEIPLHIRKHIYDYLLPLQKSEKGWERPTDYHQTLLFIGETSEEELFKIKTRMDQFIFNPFELTTKGFYFFNRRIMYLSFENSSKLTEIKCRVDEQFPEWHKSEKKTFIPHVTVKRWQRYEYNELHQGLHLRPFNNITFEVQNLSLFKSEKDSQGNKYHVIYRKHF
jgi:RNA 2',3'-cyclic 3'-phosphodiesterase